MKKIVKLSLILLVVIFIMGNVYGAFSCEMSIHLEKTEFSKNEEFDVDVNVANIGAQRGIISLGATLEYDKESLELVKMEGKNGWETPTEGSSYNENNGKMAINRNGFGKNNETIFTITFKVKESSKKNLIVALKNITVADGIEPVKIDLTYKNVTITDGTPNEMPEPPTDEVETSKNQNSDEDESSNSVKNKENSNKDTLNKNSINNNNAEPKSENKIMIIFIIIIALAILVTGGFFIKKKVLGK